MNYRSLEQNERMILAVIIIIVTFFALNSLVPLFFGSIEDAFFMHYKMTLSFLGGIVAGVVFLVLTTPTSEKPKVRDIVDRNMEILGRALNKDETQILEMIRDSEGITQDSLKYRTGFPRSKVSTLLTHLEKRGIIFREEAGRTYKLFIGDWLKKGH